MDAITLMYQNRIGSVLVTERGNPTGLFSERDVPLRAINRSGEGDSLDKRLQEVSSTPLVIAPLGISAREAASMMKSKGIKRLPLTKDGTVVGIVTARDLVEAYLSSIRKTILS